MTTLLEVAEAAGVSRTAASYAYGRPERLSPIVRARILETAERLGYAGPDNAARALRTKQSGTFGMLITERLSYAFDDPATVVFLQGVSRVAERFELGITLLSIDAATPPDRPLRAAIDGLICYSVDGPHPILDEVVRRGIPTVLVDSPKRPGCSNVTIEDRKAARSAARHLLDLGHRRFGILVDRLPNAPRRGPDRSVSELRVAGYRAELGAAGIATDDIVLAAVDRNSIDEGRAGAARLLDHPMPPTAILAATDILAFGALDVLSGRGLEPGVDVSIIGFDDLPAAAARNLSTIAQPLTEKGTKAAELLMEHLHLNDPHSPNRGALASVPRTLLLATTLVARRSTGKPPTRTRRAQR